MRVFEVIVFQGTGRFKTRVVEPILRTIGAPAAAGLAFFRRSFTPDPAAPPERNFSISRDLFLRGLGLLLLAAFVSAGLQLPGLIGSKGVLPLAESLKAVAVDYGPRRFFLLPTLFWFHAGDLFLTGACWLGAACSLLLALGILPLPCLLAAWALYLSIVVGGAEFFDFQWDFLLLEMAFLALFLAPPLRLSPSRRKNLPPAMRWLLLWLLFRVVFFSGVVKLVGADPSWGSLNALRYFFQSQPLPTPPGWWAQKLPDPVLSGLCLVVLVIELGIPFFMLFGRRLRLASFAILAAFQAALLVFANTNFLNHAVLLLLLMLVDDAAWRKSLLLRPLTNRYPERPLPGRTHWVLVPYFLFIAIVSIVQTAADLGHRGPWPSSLLSLYRFNVPMRLTGHYGYTLTSLDYRPQIVLEGTLDGREWKEYSFRWAPGDPKRMPGFSSPHSPRLEARLWLASYSRCEDVPWFQQFTGRLAMASPAVLSLLAKDPFNGQAPLTVRSMRYGYRFSDFPEWRRTGEWWVRFERGEFCPPVSKPD